MKIQKITLKEVEVVEINGEYEKRFINEKTYPAFLTNAAIKKGNDEGLLDSSLFTDLLKMRDLNKLFSKPGADEDEEKESVALNSFDEGKMINVVYLAFAGANRKSELTYEEFIDRYHYTLSDTLKLYVGLITDLITGDNAFAKGLEKSAKKEKKNTKTPS